MVTRFLILIMFSINVLSASPVSSQTADDYDREKIRALIQSSDWQKRRDAFTRALAAEDIPLLRESLPFAGLIEAKLVVEMLQKHEDVCAVPGLVLLLEKNGLPTASNTEIDHYKKILDQALVAALEDLTSEATIYKDIPIDDMRKLLLDQYRLWWDAHEQFLDCN